MRTIALVIVCASCTPSPSSVATNDAPADMSTAPSATATVSAAPDSGAHRVGEFYFIDAGVQVRACEEGSPPVPVERGSSHSTSCWYAGTSCAGHGTHINDPFALTGAVVSGETIHGGCDRGTFALVYERGTSPLRVRVCETRPKPMDCPAMVRDGASWNITTLLDANHATAAELLKAP